MKNGPPNAIGTIAPRCPVVFSASPENSRCNRVNLIGYLFGADPNLMQFFFTQDQTQLNFRDRSTTLRMAARHIDIGQYTLVRLALDIWLGGIPRTKAMEIPAFLSTCQIENLTIVFAVIAANKGCSCQTCTQRLGELGFVSSFTSQRDS